MRNAALSEPNCAGLRLLLGKLRNSSCNPTNGVPSDPEAAEIGIDDMGQHRDGAPKRSARLAARSKATVGELREISGDDDFVKGDGNGVRSLACVCLRTSLSRLGET